MAEKFVRTIPLYERIDCSKFRGKPYLIASRCGKSRDCLNDDRVLPLDKNTMCGMLAWCGKHPTRFVEVWTPDKSRKVMTVRSQWRTERLLGYCGQSAATEAGAPGAASAATPFTVNIPGISDIIKMPSLNTPKLRWERYQRFKNSHSALPDVLSWIPGLLTKLDNAQDILFTGLAMAWPIFKMLGPRFAGPLGILLTVNDGLNLATCLLSAPLKLVGPKASCLSVIADTVVNRKYHIKRAERFLLKFPWKSFLIQAPQALNSFSVYGLQLGTIMGSITDLTWGLIRAPWNGLPRIQGPPPSDPAAKAARYLTIPPVHYYHSALFTYEEHWLLSAADVIATGILMQSGNPYGAVARETELAQTPTPHVVPWHAETTALLTADGWSPDAPQRQAIPGIAPRATYGEVLPAIGNNLDRWIEDIRSEFPATDDATAFMLMLSQNGTAVYDWFAPPGAGITPAFTFEELTIAHSFEWNIFPPDDATPLQVAYYLDRCQQIAAGRGRDYASAADMKDAMFDAFGSWESR